MELVGSGLKGNANDSALEIAEFGGGVLRDKIEFLNSVGCRRVSQEVVRDLVIVQTIQKEVIGLFAVSVDEGPATAPNIVARVETGRGGRDSAGREQRQFNVVARSQR